MANDRNIAKLLNLRIPDLLIQSQTRSVNFSEEAFKQESIIHLSGEVQVQLRHREQGDLPGIEPEGPFACSLFSQNCDHPLQRAQNGSVDDDRPVEACLDVLLDHVRVLNHFVLRVFVRGPGLVLQVEALGQVEVELDGPALVLAFQGVVDLDIDFRAVEGPVARVDFPGLAQVLQAFGQLAFGCLPELLAAQGGLGPGRQLEFVVEAQQAVDVVQEVKTAFDLVLDLVLAAENVAVVLHEPPDSGQPCEGPRELVPVKHSELGDPQRQVLVRPQGVVEDEAVPRTVHRLHAVLLPFDVEHEHVVLVLGVVA